MVLSATHDQDAFSLQSVQQQDIQDFCYALGHVKMLIPLFDDSVLSDVASPSTADLYKQVHHSIRASHSFPPRDHGQGLEPHCRGNAHIGLRTDQQVPQRRLRSGSQGASGSHGQRAPPDVPGGFGLSTAGDHCSPA